MSDNNFNEVSILQRRELGRVGSTTKPLANTTNYLEFIMFTTDDDTTNLIYSYTRREAIEDGFLIDVSQSAYKLGFICSVAVTTAVWDRFIDWTEEDTERQTIQDREGRLHDVLWLLYLVFKITKPKLYSESFYKLKVVPRDGKSRRSKEFSLKAHYGLGDEGEPVITVSMPNED